jgi:GMP synthase PP-ATPase subunit
VLKPISLQAVAKELEDARYRSQAAEKEATRLRAKPVGMSDERRQLEYDKTMSIISTIDKLVADVLSTGFSLLDDFLTSK